ncbi:DUF4417 domain-containing protein [Bifidobacterium apri]|uniref:Uncharacterized protein n=1 Tax=Bifidobacterium apri TaxID=1769423 RepID=A0A6A2VI11_9BIFI|nr:DUF4417 domain-containing protein [Bifidobacterium apri]KAB8299582.1 hypothetical protein DSM100238_0616 [Bifidobacterium apri]
MCEYRYYVHVPLTAEAALDSENLYRSPDAHTTAFTEDEFMALEYGVFQEFSECYDLLIDIDEEAELGYEYLDDAIDKVKHRLARPRSEVEKSALHKLLNAMQLAKKTGYYVDIDAFIVPSTIPNPSVHKTSDGTVVLTSDETWRPETGPMPMMNGFSSDESIRSRFGSGKSLDIKGLATFLEEDAKAHGIQFTNNGWPQFPQSMLLAEEPADMLPWRQRHFATNPANTVLCHFDSDEQNYRRIVHMNEDLHEYRKFMAMAGFDLSPRIQWDQNQQKFNILLSMLATLYVGNRGVKIMPNFRTGDSDTFESLTAYPHGTQYAVGSLGCADGHTELNDYYLRMKTLVALPKKLYYYGTLKDEYRETLDDLHIDYTVFPDLRSRTFHRNKTAGSDESCLREADADEQA